MVILASILTPVKVGASSLENITDLSVSPAITEWIIAPGHKATKTIIVRNTTSKIIPVQAFVQPMHIDEPMSEASKKRYDATEWFTVNDTDFILRPKQGRKVTITITVPKNAEPGGKYATVYFRQLSSASFTPQTYIVPRIGVLSMVVVKGKITKLLQIDSVNLEKRDSTLRVKTNLQNIGNVHAFSQGSLIITDWWGKVVARLPLQIGMVMPQTTRAFLNEWKPPGPGVYTVKAELQMGAQRLSPKSATIWWLPLQEIALLGGLMLFVWFGIVKVRHRWVRALQALIK
jgi:hypothetical protein